MPFLAHPAAMAFHPMLGDRVGQERYIDHLAHTLRPTLRKRSPTVRAPIQPVLNNLGGSLMRTNIGTRALLANFLLPSGAVCLYRKRNSTRHSRRRILAKPLILSFQSQYTPSKIKDQGDQIVSRKGIKVLHALHFTKDLPKDSLV